MSDLKFRSPLWISFYLGIVPNVVWFASVLFVIVVLNWQQGISYVLSLPLFTFFALLVPISLFAVVL